MNELPTDPHVQSYAILRLEAQGHAIRAMLALLIADNPTALEGLRRYANMVEDLGLAAMLTDEQITQMRGEMDLVLDAAGSIHGALGIGPDMKPDTRSSEGAPPRS